MSADLSQQLFLHVPRDELELNKMASLCEPFFFSFPEEVQKRKCSLLNSSHQRLNVVRRREIEESHFDDCEITPFS